jgi:hypothetical protein
MQRTRVDLNRPAQISGENNLATFCAVLDLQVNLGGQDNLFWA